MKPITAITVFFSLMIPSLFLSYGNYTIAKEYIIDDVNQALAQTVVFQKVCLCRRLQILQICKYSDSCFQINTPRPVDLIFVL